MNRRTFFKSMGHAVGGLAALPLVSLLPEAVTTYTDATIDFSRPIVRAPGGLRLRRGMEYQLRFYNGHLLEYRVVGDFKKEMLD